MVTSWCFVGCMTALLGSKKVKRMPFFEFIHKNYKNDSLFCQYTRVCGLIVIFLNLLCDDCDVTHEGIWIWRETKFLIVDWNLGTTSCDIFLMCMDWLGSRSLTMIAAYKLRF